MEDVLRAVGISDGILDRAGLMLIRQLLFWHVYAAPLVPLIGGWGR